MTWKFYILWLISFLAGVLFVCVLPGETPSPSVRYLFLGLWGAILGALFNAIASKKATDTEDDFAIEPSRKQPETEFIPVIGESSVPSAADAPEKPRILAPEFPDEDWIEFSHELLRNRPFSEVVRKLNELLPRIFKRASGVLYMYGNNQSELHQIFAFGENTISDPVIVPAECASFDSARIVVADYSDPQHVNGCTHLHHRPQGYSFCAPIEGLEEHFGILSIQIDELPEGETAETWKTKISMVATAFGLFVANQNLQVRFKT